MGTCFSHLDTFSSAVNKRRAEGKFDVDKVNSLGVGGNGATGRNWGDVRRPCRPHNIGRGPVDNSEKIPLFFNRKPDIRNWVSQPTRPNRPTSGAAARHAAQDPVGVWEDAVIEFLQNANGTVCGCGGADDFD